VGREGVEPPASSGTWFTATCSQPIADLRPVLFVPSTTQCQTAAEAGRLALHALDEHAPVSNRPRASRDSASGERKEEDSNPRHLSALTLFSRQVRSHDQFSFHDSNWTKSSESHEAAKPRSEHVTDKGVRDSRRIDSREPARPARPVSRNSLSLHRHSRALARTTVGDGRYLRTVIVTMYSRVHSVTSPGSESELHRDNHGRSPFMLRETKTAR
jgi:hypothetical protein